MHLPAGIPGLCVQQETAGKNHHQKTHSSLPGGIGAKLPEQISKTSDYRKTVNLYYYI